MPLEDFIITVFCRVEERLNALLGDHRLRQRGLAPKLADSGKARVNTDRPIDKDVRSAVPGISLLRTFPHNQGWM
ncbi:MAG: hypothetical protein P9E24_02910 [Candidatus Competibacter sp.]|nr:hypothetical protein [Candidatus Competibacter sp.]MDG4583169.1 hypothetical protein [Candidatus Competibacter sp.]